MQKDFSGVWTALVTPMGESRVDYDSLENLVEMQVRSGVAGIVSVGTTGESPTLSHEEHLEVIRKTVEYAAGRIPVYAGTGSNCTSEAVHLTREADAAGADGFLVVAPYYNKPSQEGVFLHMSEVAKCTEKPIVLYSIPGRCGIEISNQTANRLRESFRNVCVLKEAGGKAEKVADLHGLAGDKITILSGDDGKTLDFIEAGARGVISVASNIIPEKMSEMVALALSGRMAEARAIEAKYAEFFKALFIEPNPVPIKTLMALAGTISDAHVRLPLCKMSEGNLEILKSAARSVGVLK